MNRVSRHIDVVVPMQEEADPEGAVLPLAADLQGNDLWRGREEMVARAARPVVKAWQPLMTIAIAPTIEERP
jgi:hypothetical protein